MITFFVDTFHFTPFHFTPFHFLLIIASTSVSNRPHDDKVIYSFFHRLQSFLILSKKSFIIFQSYFICFYYYWGPTKPLLNNNTSNWRIHFCQKTTTFEGQAKQALKSLPPSLVSLKLKRSKSSFPLSIPITCAFIFAKKPHLLKDFDTTFEMLSLSLSIPPFTDAFIFAQKNTTFERFFFSLSVPLTGAFIFAKNTTTLA